MKLYMFRTVPLSTIRSFSLHTANLYDIYHCCVYSEKTPDDGQRNSPKHAQLHSKNKFEKLVHLVVFILRYTCTIGLILALKIQALVVCVYFRNRCSCRLVLCGETVCLLHESNISFTVNVQGIFTIPKPIRIELI